MNKTLEINESVEGILKKWNKQFDEDLILKVCQEIENSPAWLHRYKELCDIQTKNVTNQFIGFYVKKISGGKRIKQVPTDQCKIIGSYTKLKF